MSDEEKKFIPKLEQKTIFREARMMVSLYSLLILGSFYLNFWGLFWYWWLPVILGEPVMRAIRLTEHVGRPNTDDLKENTRSSIVSIPMKFLCWNMNYHAEHHYASSIPFHALPKLHKKLKGYIIDLRNNPGGLLSQAIKISDFFLNDGDCLLYTSPSPRD